MKIDERDKNNINKANKQLTLRTKRITGNLEFSTYKISLTSFKNLMNQNQSQFFDEKSSNLRFNVTEEYPLFKTNQFKNYINI